VYRKQGRPPHPHHLCKHCSKDLPSAEKKHEHQRGCPARKKTANFEKIAYDKFTFTKIVFDRFT
jgi:hypothetical protein